MATLRDIKNRISGITSIEKITSAMKMVSSIKSRRTQKIAEAARPFYNNVEDILRVLMSSKGVAEFDSPFFQPNNESATNSNAVKNVVILVVAGDKGMCGAFNNALFRAVDTYIKKELKSKYPNCTPSLILIGNKTLDYYRKKEYPILGEFPNTFNKLNAVGGNEYRATLIEEIRSLIISEFVNGTIDRVEVFYNRFVNLMKQVPANKQLLPISFNLDEKNNNKFKLIKTNNDDKEIANIDYIFEPNHEAIFEMIISQFIDLNIWSPILESNAAEQTARLIAMDKATQNAQDLIKDLELQYNNARQASITTEMLEIVGGAEALSK